MDVFAQQSAATSSVSLAWKDVKQLEVSASIVLRAEDHFVTKIFILSTCPKILGCLGLTIVLFQTQ